MDDGIRMPTPPLRALQLQRVLAGRTSVLSFRAFRFAQGVHRGLRKDGCTPEFDHPVSVTLHLLPLLGDLERPDLTLATALLHDTVEDCNVAPHDLARRFGPDVAGAVWSLTKAYRGRRRGDALLMRGQAAHVVAGPVKAADRLHNVETLRGALSTEMALAYLEETEQLIVPMIMEARRLHPRQQSVYASLLRCIRQATARQRSAFRRME